MRYEEFVVSMRPDACKVRLCMVDYDVSHAPSSFHLEYQQKRGSLQNAPNLSLTDILGHELEEDKITMMRKPIQPIDSALYFNGETYEGGAADLPKNQPSRTASFGLWFKDRLFGQSLTCRECALLMLLILTLVALPLSARPWKRSCPVPVFISKSRKDHRKSKSALESFQFYLHLL